MDRPRPEDMPDTASRNGLSLYYVLEGLDLPKGTKLRGSPEGTWITEPGEEPYLLADVS